MCVEEMGGILNTFAPFSFSEPVMKKYSDNYVFDKEAVTPEPEGEGAESAFAPLPL